MPLPPGSLECYARFNGEELGDVTAISYGSSIFLFASTFNAEADNTDDEGGGISKISFPFASAGNFTAVVSERYDSTMAWARSSTAQRPPCYLPCRVCWRAQTRDPRHGDRICNNFSNNAPQTCNIIDSSFVFW